MNNNEQNIELNGETTFNIIKRHLMTGNIAKFDMTCTLYEHRQNGTISVSLNASLDIYDELMISTMANRLKNIFQQLFSVSAIYEFSLLLPHELEIIRDLNNTYFDSYESSLLSQKMGVELDDQSLTYAELLYYAQVLSLYLLNEHEIVPGEINCQCVERSLSMVS
jgi:hypothetical protein